jgi:DNA-binding transcriptional ArsR family regulator
MPRPAVTYNQMVVGIELSDDEIDRVFHALAAATRRDILRRTIDGEHSVSALAREYDMSFAAVQKHVGVLEAAGLIVKRAEGRERLVRADPTMIARARALLARYEDLWRARIDRLDALLAEPAGSGGAAGAPRTTEERTKKNDPRNEGE